MDSLLYPFAFLFFTFLWAVVGHGLFLVYRYAWRSMLGLVGVGGGKPSPVVPSEENPPADDSDASPVREWLRKHVIRLVGLVGAALAAGAFFWLLEDLAVEDFLKKCIQMAALLVLTFAISSWGVLLRRRSADLMGTGLMLLGFLMVPADAAFYETEILGYTTHSSYKVGLFLAGLAFWFTHRTGSRTFAWLAPSTLLTGILLIGDKLDWSSTVMSYLACLMAPLLLAVSLWLDQREAGRKFVRPLRLATLLAALVALGACLSSTPDLFPALHLFVVALGGGSIAAVAFLEADLRAVFILIPYFVPIVQHRFWELGEGFGWGGPLAALAALGILAFERTRRTGLARQRGLDPACSVVATTLILFALIADGWACLGLLGPLSGLVDVRDRVGLMGTGPEVVMTVWFESQRALFYLSRRASILVAMCVSGLFTAMGLSYLGSQTRIRFFAFIAGLPLAASIGAAVLHLWPPELHSETYVFTFAGAILGLFLASLTRVVRPEVDPETTPESFRIRNGIGDTCALAGHLLVPPTFILAGHRIWSPGSVPDWFSSLVLALIGAQFMASHALQYGLPRVGGDPSLATTHEVTGLFRFGLPPRFIGSYLLIGMAWPVSLASISRWETDFFSVFVSLAVVGLIVQAAMLWWAVNREWWAAAASSGVLLAITLMVMADRVYIGGPLTKVLVLAFGLGLLWLGARGRRGGSGSAMTSFILISMASLLASPVRGRGESEKVPVTRERIERLLAAAPEDPLIRLRARAAGDIDPSSIDTKGRWNQVDSNLAGMSGIDSAAAALQIAASPERLAISDEEIPDFTLSWMSQTRHVELDYLALAKRSGHAALPRLGSDLLDGLPESFIHLRFESPASLVRILEFYGRIGQSVLAVTAPGLALPGPDSIFFRRFGVRLATLTEGSSRGSILMPDPYLDLTTEIALVLEMPDVEAAQTRSLEWAETFPQSPSGAFGRLAVLATDSHVFEKIESGLNPASHATVTLANASDYRYARLLNLKAADGFLFIGEGFIRELVSPESWIRTNRRGDCLAEVADLEAAVYFGRATGRALPEDPEAAHAEAVERGWIVAGGECRDGGSYHKITGVLACSQHGNRVAPLGFPAPPTEIYQAERMAYSAFSRRYEALYRQFIDPILVGLTLESRVARIETAILPVARLMYYNSLLAATSRGEAFKNRMPLPPGARGALLGIAFRCKAEDSGWGWNGGYYGSSDPARRVIQRARSAGALGSTMGMLLLPGDLTTLVAPPLLWKDPRPVPILAFQEMGHPDRAREYVQALFGEGSGVPGASGSLLFQSPLLGIKRVYGALVGNSLLAGLDEGFVAKAAGMPAERGSLPGATAWMKVNPGDLWQALPESTNPAFLHLANSCLRVVAARQNLADLSRDVEPGPALLHDPFVDFSAGCPSGGTYSDSPGGAVRCSLHGDPAEKKQGAPLPGSPLHNLLGAIGSLDVELAFTPGGIRTQMTFRQ